MVNPLIVAAGIQAGGSLLGGLFGGGESETKINYNAIRRDSERAGFNPLTALRNGASAGFTTTMHPPAFGAAISDAANAFASVFANMDPNKDRMEEIQFKLAEASLDNLQTDTALRLRRLSLGDAPSYSAGTTKRQVGTGVGLVPPGIQSSLPGFGTVFGPSQPKPADQTASNPFPHGSGFVVAGNVPDLETGAEARYGDFVSIPFGVFNLAADAYANFRKYRPDVDSMIRENLKKAPAREKRLREQAARNARELGFPGY